MPSKKEPVQILEKHLRELQESAINDEIIRLNFKSLSRQTSYEFLLYPLERAERRNDGRLRDKWLKRYSHLDYGGWWCSGIDPLSGEPMDWGCFKPDSPKKSGGKVIKYEHPPQTPTRVFWLKFGKKTLTKIGEHFSVTDVRIESSLLGIIDTKIPLIITEGAKKTASLLSNGYLALGLPGINNFKDKNGELIPEVKVFCRSEREIIIAFDKDTTWLTKNAVTKATKTLGALLESEGCDISVLEWNPKTGKGIDDFIYNQGEQREEELCRIFDERISLEEYKEQQKVKFLKRPDLIKFFQRNFKGRWAWNDLTMELELDGKPYDLSDEFINYLVEEYNCHTSENLLYSVVNYESKKNRYHPVRKYLERVSNLPPINLDTLANRYFGSQSVFDNILLKKWLIAAVMRAYTPLGADSEGTKFDDALILQGDQGALKSTFFKILGGKWFGDSFGSNIDSPKALMVLHKSWIQEWSEFDRVASKNDVSLVKSFLSRQVDEFVRPYGRISVRHPRQGVMCGSVNPANFLKDSTGDRRFWVIALPKGWRIPVDIVQGERDRIWAAAYQAWKSGEKPYLNEKEMAQLRESNEQFRDYDEWMDIIGNYLEETAYNGEKLTRISIYRLAIEALNLGEEKLDRRVQNRIRESLIQLGWVSIGSRHEVQYDNRRRRLWESPGFSKIEQNYQKSQSNGHGVTSKITSHHGIVTFDVTAQNSHDANVSETVSRQSPQNPQTFSEQNIITIGSLVYLSPHPKLVCPCPTVVTGIEGNEAWIATFPQYEPFKVPFTRLNLWRQKTSP